MRRPWLQLVVALFVSLSLLAAPCRNCQPKQETKTGECGHDCCPKPKPVPSKTCSWQPAEYDVTEAKASTVADAPAVVLVSWAPVLDAGVAGFQAEPVLIPFAPPPQHSILRI